MHVTIGAPNAPGVYPSTQEKVVLAEIVVLRVAACAKAGVMAALVGQ